MFKNLREPELLVSFAMSAVPGPKVHSPQVLHRDPELLEQPRCFFCHRYHHYRSPQCPTQSQHTTANKATGIGSPTNSTRRVVGEERRCLPAQTTAHVVAGSSCHFLMGLFFLAQGSWQGQQAAATGVSTAHSRCGRGRSLACCSGEGDQRRLPADRCIQSAATGI
jgi:hypothetical protein